MAEVIHRDKRDGYEYDPIIKQYDTTFWKTVTGTPAISNNLLRYNASSSASFLQHLFADIEFLLTIPAKPTAGDVRQFGLKNPSSTSRGAIYFDITGTVFSLKIYDDNGNTSSTVINWKDPTWTNTPIAFRIRWEKDHINVYVNNALITTIPQSTIMSPYDPLVAYINNGNADNMDLTYMLIRRAASII